MNVSIFVFHLLLSNIAFAASNQFFESFDFLPNSLSYQTAQSSTEMQLAGRQNLKVSTKSFNNINGEINKFVSRLQMKKINLESKNKFDFTWGPTGSFAFYPFAIDSEDIFFSETDFQFFRVLLGYGPEARFNFDFGSIIFSASPGIQYSWVSWSSPISAGTFDRFETSFSGSIQLLKSITHKVFLQIFYESVLEDNLTWEKAMTSSQGFPVSVKQVNSSSIGISIGYSWN